MTQFEKLKAEITEMSLDDFMSNFVTGKGMREYICSDIKYPHAHCTKTDDYSCIECLKEHLRGEAV
ncbi:MAG: hypothetical protein U0L88_16730 [Acutalibacteraceae bacterium]|nr:hypothetical protein [Acutalibacteraceae bacterium]